MAISTQIYAQDIWTGTGFALNNGYLVTNWHVADGAETINVYGVQGNFNKKYKAEVVAKDVINDLAILRITDNDFPGFGTVPYKVRTSTAEVAEEVFVLGFPMTDIMGDEVKFSVGIINSLSGIEGDKSTYQISAQVSHGSSGGPVFDDYGNLVGIISSGLDAKVQQNVYYAIKTSYLKNLVETMYVDNVLPTSSLLGNYTKRQDKFKAVKNFVFYIECNGKVNNVNKSGNVVNGHEYIDLGLPSGTMWATCNIGATEPYEYGYHFAWGEVRPKTTYTWQTYKYCRGNADTMTKYNFERSSGYIDYIRILQPSDDAATANWGTGWRMPTKTEIEELMYKCSWKWMPVNGVECFIIIGPNGNYIFIPAGGFYQNSSRNKVGEIVTLWSSTLGFNYGCDAWNLNYYSGELHMKDVHRYYGRSIRAVCSPMTVIPRQ